VNVQGNGVGNIASLNRVLVDGNTTFAIQGNGAGNILAVINSVLNASPSAIILAGGATATSFGPSNVVSGAGAFTTTNPFK
jgi:O-glycosyl hydrolase